MKKIFGNLFFLLSAPIFALSTASVNQTWFYPGDEIVLTLSSNGNKVVFPVINNIAGRNILYTSNSQKISIVNSKSRKQTSRSYAFKPLKSLSIPAYILEVDGAKQTTKPIKITLKKPTKTKVGDDYILQVKVDKPTFFLGDKANLSIIFKIKKPLLDKVRLSKFGVKDLLFTQGKIVQSADKNYNIFTLNYKISANNFGTFKIPSLVAIISGKNKRIYSNTLKLKVKPLPNTLIIFGDFTIKARVDKLKVKKGDAVILVVTINGKGNFEDIEEFKFDIDNTTIYNYDAVFSHKDWQQKFAIVGGQDFTIPSLSIEFFDEVTQKKKRISTQRISIQVEQGALPKKATTTQTPKGIDSKAPVNNKLKYYYLLLGIVAGLIIGVAVPVLKNKKQHKHQDLIKQIKSAKGNKQLFDLLLPLNLGKLEPILQQLEANLYKDETHKINKKDIVAIVKGSIT